MKGDASPELCCCGQPLSHSGALVSVTAVSRVSCVCACVRIYSVLVFGRSRRALRFVRVLGRLLKNS